MSFKSDFWVLSGFKIIVWTPVKNIILPLLLFYDQRLLIFVRESRVVSSECELQEWQHLRPHKDIRLLYLIFKCLQMFIIFTYWHLIYLYELSLFYLIFLSIISMHYVSLLHIILSLWYMVFLVFLLCTLTFLELEQSKSFWRHNIFLYLKK